MQFYAQHLRICGCRFVLWSAGTKPPFLRQLLHTTGLMFFITSLHSDPHSGGENCSEKLSVKCENVQWWRKRVSFTSLVWCHHTTKQSSHSLATNFHSPCYLRHHVQLSAALFAAIAWKETFNHHVFLP